MLHAKTSIFYVYKFYTFCLQKIKGMYQKTMETFEVAFPIQVKVTLPENESVDVVADTMLMKSQVFNRNFPSISGMTLNLKDKVFLLSDPSLKSKHIVNKFIQLCHGQEPENLSFSEIAALALIAEDWEADDIQNALFEKMDNDKSNYESNFSQLLEKYNNLKSLLKTPELRNEKGNVGETIERYFAKNFMKFIESNLIFKAPTELIQKIIKNKYFARPPKKVFNKFILSCIEADFQNLNLIALIDPFDAELPLLEKVVNILEFKGAAEAFPMHKEVCRLRNLEQKKDKIVEELFVNSKQLKILNASLSNLQETLKKLQQKETRLRK